MSRPAAWPEMLAAFIDARRAMPFTWEENNCGFVACDWVREITGIDPAANYRGLVGPLETKRAVRLGGGAETIFAEAAEANGWPVIMPALAGRGDVLLHFTPRGAALGICVGTHGAFMRKKGLGMVPVRDCARAWRIS